MADASVPKLAEDVVEKPGETWVAEIPLKGGAIGLARAVMRDVTHIATAIAAFFFTATIVRFSGAQAPLAYVLGFATSASMMWRRFLQLPRVPACPRARPQRDSRARAIRLGPAALQRLVSRARARAVPALLRGGRWGHSVQPLAGGKLSGKHDRGQEPAKGTRFTISNAGAMYQERY